MIKYNKNREKHNFTFVPEKGKHSNDDVRILIDENSTENDYKLSVNIEPKVEIQIDDFYLEIEYEFDIEDRIFLNGYQTWTETREFRADEKMEGFPLLLMPIIEGKHKLTGFGDYKFHDYPGKKGKLHGYTYTYVKDKDNYCVMIGSLSEKTGFTVYDYDTYKNKIIIRKECSGLTIQDKYMVFELLFTEGTGKEIFDNYFKAMNLSNQEKSPVTGWTSWYNYYNGITQDIVFENLENFASKKIPVDIFQIDDGFQKSVGDWKETNDKFPDGMKYVSDKIKEKGYKSGIWIAPFVCEEKSDIFIKKKDWILKDESGKYVCAGNYDKWGGDFYSLDVYNEDFRKYLREVFNLICNNWNFDVIKVDFIYAAAVIPRKDKTRGEIINDAIDFLCDISKGKKILGCGVPLGTVFGKIEYCRVGPDIALIWEDSRLKTINYRERISTVSSLTNSLSRLQLNNRAFLNDPDVFILRKENVELNEDQKHTLYLVNLITGGLVFTSDNIANYDEDTMKLYLSGFPYRKKNILEVKSKGNVFSVSYMIGKLQYLAYINLSGLHISLKMETGNYFGYGEIFSGETHISLNAYESMNFLKIGDGEFEIAGSTGSLFPGNEIENAVFNREEIIFTVNESFLNKEELQFKVPDGISEIKINGQLIKTIKIENFNIAKISI